MTAPAGGFTTPPAPQQPVDQFGRPYQGVPQQQPGQQPAQQPAPQQQVGFDPNARISGPGFPPELQGKTVGEAMRYYQVMREDFVSRNRPGQQQQPAPQQPAPQPQGGPRNQYGQPTTQSGQPALQTNGAPQDQQGQPLQQMVQQAVAEALRPVQNVSVGTVYQQVASRFPDWVQHDSEIQQALVGADPSQLLNPIVWESAYYLVKGRKASQGQQPQQQSYQAPRNEPQPQAPAWQNGMPVDSRGQPIQVGGYPQQQQPVNQGYPQQQQYFVESPTPQPPAQGGQYGSAPQDEHWAKKFGIPVDEYRAWKGGNVPPPGQPQQQGQYYQPNQFQQPVQQFGAPQQPPMNGGYRGY